MVLAAGGGDAGVVVALFRVTSHDDAATRSR